MENNRKIKICHVASADITVRFLLLSQLKFLKQQGYDVYAVCSEGKWTDFIRNEGIKLKTIELKRKISPFSDLLALFELFVYFKKEKFDIVHTHTPKPGLLGQMAASFAGVPVIINTVHGLYFGNKFSKAKKNFYIFTEKVSGKFSDLIFSQNKEDISTMTEKKIAKPEIIKYLGNGIDLQKFDRKRFSQDFLNKKKNEVRIPDDYKVVGAVGRLVEEKGYLELFSAFKEVLKVFPKTILMIAGPEDLIKKDALDKNAVKNYGIEKNTIFLGERGDIDELLPLMDIFVLASHREGFPRTIIEAMAERVPVISTNIRGCREAIDDKKTGILVPIDNPDEIAKQIIFLFNNPKTAQELAENAYVKTMENFNENSVFAKIKEEYQKLLCHHQPKNT
jgi:glycosyltransferase involved in cell wall biosynthesis